MSNQPDNAQPIPQSDDELREREEWANAIRPLEHLLKDPDVVEILINRYDEIFYDHRGTESLHKSDTAFESEAHLRHLVDMILKPLGRVINESNPIVDVRLADGTMVNVVIPPIASYGTVITMRKFVTHIFSTEDLIHFGSLSQPMMQFLQACVQANLNVAVAGGAGSGKTTIFNTLAQFIPDKERLILVEDRPSAVIEDKHMVRLESRPPNLQGKGEISMTELVVNALKMRPDRVLVTEVNGAEVLHLLQAMNTGHDGSMFTIHANNPRDVIARLEVMALMANMEVPVRSIREQIAAAVDIIVQQMRLRDGSRKILQITEVTGMEGTTITMNDIFEFRQTDYQEGRIIGHFTPTGYVPRCLDRLQEKGFHFTPDFFRPESPVKNA